MRFSDPLAALGNSWHTFALRWTPSDLTFYYDDTPTWSMTAPISRRSQYIILSSEVGQFFAGPIPAGGYGARAASTTNMQVDYVRVWTFAPVNRALPVASGTPAAGAALACSAGSWTGDPAPAFSYEWLSDGSLIAGASGPSYTARATDEGHALSCRVTATNSLGSARAQSDALLIALPPAALAPASLEVPALAPPPSRAVVDSTAPIARLAGSRSQKLGGTVAVTISCPAEDCRAIAAGTVRVPRLGRTSARTYRPATVTTIVAQGRTVTVRLRLSSSARAAIDRALRARRRIVATVSVRVADRAGNIRALSRRIALRR